MELLPPGSVSPSYSAPGADYQEEGLTSPALPLAHGANPLLVTV